MAKKKSASGLTPKKKEEFKRIAKRLTPTKKEIVREEIGFVDFLTDLTRLGGFKVSRKARKGKK